MAFYKKQFNERTNVYYPQAVTVGAPIDTKKVAERLAQISTVSKADVAAVLAELPGVMADYMSQGKSVRLDGLGTFRYTLDTNGVATEEEFDFQAQLKAVRVQFTPQRAVGRHPRLDGQPPARARRHRVAGMARQGRGTRRRRGDREPRNRLN